MAAKCLHAAAPKDVLPSPFPIISEVNNKGSLKKYKPQKRLFLCPVDYKHKAHCAFKLPDAAII